MNTAETARARVAGVFDQLAANYDQGPVPWFKPIANRLVELLAPQPGEQALDIGCGRGAVTFPLSAAVGETGHVTAIDLSPAMAEHLRREAAARSTGNLDVLVGEAGRHSLAAASFDVIAASAVLFFDPTPEATLAEWVSLGNGGTGRIGLTTFGPIDDLWQEAERLVLAHAPRDLLDPRTAGVRGPFATTETMAELLRGCGAQDVDSHDEPLEIVLQQAQDWRDWSMTTGFREIWNAVPDDRLESVFEAAAAILEGARQRDGRLHLTQQVRYTTGRIP